MREEKGDNLYIIYERIDRGYWRLMTEDIEENRCRIQERIGGGYRGETDKTYGGQQKKTVFIGEN